MATIIYEESNIDFETGEIKSKSTTKKFRSEEPNYVKLYLADIAFMHDLPATASNLIHELLNYLTYNTQEIALTSHVKKRIADNLGITLKTLYNRLNQLANKGIIEKEGSGTYKLNPYLFGKGDWKAVRELRKNNLHLEILYDAETNTRKIRGKVDE